ncbi:MAG: hypothetical protein JNL42_04315 [Anaerolineae bacterium]|nr:hypothetical protein [Anaerolineae bacterium]
MKTRMMIFGGIAGALLALSGIMFWSYLPNHDLLRFLGALSNPELAAPLDSRYLFASALVFALSLNAIFGVLRLMMGLAAMGIAGAIGGVVLAAIFGIDEILVSSLTVNIFGGELTVDADVRVIFAGFLLFLILSALVQGIVRYVYPDRENFTAVLRSSLIAACAAAAVVALIDSFTPPSRIEQIAQMQTAVAATATENSVQIALRATLAPTETAVAKRESYELTVIAQLAATLNQASPTHPSEATGVPEATPTPNLLETQLAQALAELTPTASSMSSTVRNTEDSTGSSDADLWLQRLEAIATIFGGGGVLGLLTLLLRRRSSKQDIGY